MNSDAPSRLRVPRQRRTAPARGGHPVPIGRSRMALWYGCIIVGAPLAVAAPVVLALAWAR